MLAFQNEERQKRWEKSDEEVFAAVAFIKSKYASDAREELVWRRLRKLKRVQGGRKLYEIEGEELLKVARRVREIEVNNLRNQDWLILSDEVDTDEEDK